MSAVPVSVVAGEHVAERAGGGVASCVVGGAAGYDVWSASSGGSSSDSVVGCAQEPKGKRTFGLDRPPRPWARTTCLAGPPCVVAIRRIVHSDQSLSGDPGNATTRRPSLRQHLWTSRTPVVPLSTGALGPLTRRRHTACGAPRGPRRTFRLRLAGRPPGGLDPTGRTRIANGTHVEGGWPRPGEAPHPSEQRELLPSLLVVAAVLGVVGAGHDAAALRTTASPH